MSIRTLTDRETDETVLYNSSTNRAFGPVFESPEHAEAFLTWLGQFYSQRDVMELFPEQLDLCYGDWLKVWRHNAPLPKGSIDLQFITLCRAYIRAGFEHADAWATARSLVLNPRRTSWA